MYCNCHKSFHQFYVSLARLILKTLLHIEVIAAVEVAVADGFHDVVLADLDAAFEVGDGAGDFQDAVVGSRAHVHLGDGLAEFFHSFGVGFGIFV